MRSDMEDMALLVAKTIYSQIDDVYGKSFFKWSGSVPIC